MSGCWPCGLYIVLVAICKRQTAHLLVVDSMGCHLLCRSSHHDSAGHTLAQFPTAASSYQQLATCIWDRHGCHSLGLAPDVLQRLRPKLHLSSAQRLSGSKACKLRQCQLVCLSHVFVHHRLRHAHICAEAAAIAVYKAAPELVQLQRRDQLEARQAPLGSGPYKCSAKVSGVRPQAGAWLYLTDSSVMTVITVLEGELLVRSYSTFQPQRRQGSGVACQARPRRCRWRWR